MRTLFSALLLTALGALTSLPTAADPIIANSPKGQLVLAAPDARVLQLADGEHLELPLASSARLHGLASVAESWWTAGVEIAPSKLTPQAGEDRPARRLVLLGGYTDVEAGGVRALPVPQVEASQQLREPVLLTQPGGLAGLAWLEGDAPRRQVLKVARFTDGSWNAPVTIAAPGPGSQMALNAADLGDGTWLLAWSAFDGQDDEILWSRWDGERATSPAPVALDNTVPDITPHLVSTRGGAYVAWSRFELAESGVGGSYRVHLARFHGTAWSEPVVTGPRGSLYPTLHDEDGHLLLLYRTATPAGWAVAEIGASGKVLKVAHAVEDTESRPLIVGANGEEAILSWLDSAARHVSIHWEAPADRSR